MQELLIDDRGEVWPACPETVARRFGEKRRHDFYNHAIGFGFIFVRFSDCGAQIALIPQFVSDSALSRLSGIVSQKNPIRIALATDARLSSWKLVCGTQRAISSIEQIIAEARSPSPRPLLTVRRLPLERCADIAGGKLLPPLQAWQQRRGHWEPDFFGRLLEWKLLPDSTVISQQPRVSERLLILHWGIHNRSFGKDWIRIAPGRDVEDQPNAEVGRARAALLRQTIREGVPRLLASDQVFRGIARELMRLKLTRLDLPWRACDGSVLVAGIVVARRTFVLERPDPAN